MGPKPELSRRETVGPMEKETPDKYEEACKGGTTEIMRRIFNYFAETGNVLPCLLKIQENVCYLNVAKS